MIGDIALLTNVTVTGTYAQSGTLARMPINGGDPRDVLDGTAVSLSPQHSVPGAMYGYHRTLSDLYLVVGLK